ncbi:MAG: glycosyltransferase, partial [Bdellovibrionales bacterium]
MISSTPEGFQEARVLLEAVLVDYPKAVVPQAFLVEVLLFLREDRLARDQSQLALQNLDHGEDLAFCKVPYVPGVPPFLIQAWDQADSQEAKRQVLRWRLHLILAQLGGALADFYETVLARPDLPLGRAALGCMLAREGRTREAIFHLREVVQNHPLDRQAPRVLAQLLEQSGNLLDHRQLLSYQRKLQELLPDWLPMEEWFALRRPTGKELTSIIIPCHNQLECTQECIASLLKHTPQAHELVLIDNGSTDKTLAFFQQLLSRLGPDRVQVIANPENLGFGRACNQGLQAARGEFLVLLNNDTVLTEHWLEDLLHWVLLDWPRVGMVGPLTSYASGPQQIPIPYSTAEGLQEFARTNRQTNAGKALEVERLIGFCLALRRDVFEAIGPLDERFGLGFFEDDDWCVRVRNAGYKLVLAENVFIHHHGSRTIRTLFTNPFQQLRENLQIFQNKWGEESTAGYRIPEPEPTTECSQNYSSQPPPPPPPPPPTTTTTTTTTYEHEKSSSATSLCMIVRNGGPDLERCLTSVRDLVQEIIVIDTGSEDGSQELARGLGAKVVEIPWPDSFAAARNESLQHATGDWILWLDADEWIEGDNQTLLKQLLQNLPRENIAYLMRQSSPLAEAPHARVHVDQVRLFRNLPGLAWRYRVHEQILPSLREMGAEVYTTSIVIDHAGFAENTQQQGKVDRNLRLLELDLNENPNDAFTLFNLGAIAYSRRQNQIAQDFFQRSLLHCQPGDTLWPKIQCLLLRLQLEIGHLDQAWIHCQQGRNQCPSDVELLYWDAVLRKERQDFPGAEKALRELLNNLDQGQLNGIDAGLQGHRVHHLLGEILWGQGRPWEAEAHYQTAISDCPEYLPAWQDLARLGVHLKNWEVVENCLG